MERKQCGQIDHMTTQRVSGGFGWKKAVGSGNTERIRGFWHEIAVGSGKQPIRELAASIAVEYGLKSYGCKPIESSAT